MDGYDYYGRGIPPIQPSSAAAAHAAALYAPPRAPDPYSTSFNAYPGSQLILCFVIAKSFFEWIHRNVYSERYARPPDVGPSYAPPLAAAHPFDAPSMLDRGYPTRAEAFGLGPSPYSGGNASLELRFIQDIETLRTRGANRLCRTLGAVSH